jgi:hypothetical protein
VAGSENVSAAETYERVRAACCSDTGLSDEEFETHVRSITLLVLRVRGAFA